MDPHEHRAKVRQLADDLAWLEDHCRRQPDLAVHAAHLRLAAALTRNVVGPAVEGQAAKPLFVAAPAGDPNPLADVVVWDCPDMTTWASIGYVSRLMEVVGLADVIVYVASDERYNDEVPTQFLTHLIRAGKAVVVCLTKVRETDAAALTEHFKSEVLGRLPTADGHIPPIPIVVLPQMPPDVRTDPAGK